MRGSARENSALGAGIGAATAEIYAERMGLAGIREGTYDPNSKADQDRLSRQSQIVAALATGLAGKNPSAGVQYAQNAVENNAIQVLMAAPYLAAAVEGTALGANLAFYGSAALTGIGLGFLVNNAMDAAPEASEPQVESFPETEPGAQSFVTPVHESGPQIHSTPVHDQARPSDRGFDTYNGPDASVLTRGSEIEFYQGGAYGKLPRRTGIERHHMPADSVNGIDSRYRGPSIQMEAADHRKTSSFGNSSSAQKYRSEVESLIVDGQMRKAMAKEIKDVKSNFGTKYNEAIQQMLDYSKSSGIVPKKDIKNG